MVLLFYSVVEINSYQHMPDYFLVFPASSRQIKVDWEGQQILNLSELCRHVHHPHLLAVMKNPRRKETDKNWRERVAALVMLKD